VPNPSTTENALDNMPRAMAWMIFSGICFAFMGAAVKFGGDVHLAGKVFFRNLVTLMITSGVSIRLGLNPLAPTPHLGKLLARSFCGLTGVFLYFLALEELFLADASLLNKTSPFFVVIFAAVLLKEPIKKVIWPALAVAFIGAMLVIKPSFNYDTLPALAGIGSGLFAGIAYTLVRSLKGKEHPNRIIFTFSAVSTLVTLPFLIIYPIHPDPRQWAALIATGIFAAGGQYGLTFAYHHAQASKISLFTYMHVLFSLVVGFMIWGEQPDLISILGGGLIIAAAVFTHRTNRTE
jgi:drug/metabolite transporter (DMT)-like permease